MPRGHAFCRKAWVGAVPPFASLPAEAGQDQGRVRRRWARIRCAAPAIVRAARPVAARYRPTTDRGCRHPSTSPRGPVGARPNHRGVFGHIAGLNAGYHSRPIRGAAERWPGETTKASQGEARRRADQQMPSAHTLPVAFCNRHRGTLVESRRRVPAQLDSGPKVLRRTWDSSRQSPRPSYRFQLQMPPDRHGQTWIRVSKACASSGLPCRCASLVRAAGRGCWARACAMRVL